jgi:RNA polymerase sigma-70 factor (ECF subfamily)
MSVQIADLMTHLPNLRRYARRLTQNDDSASDLVQETVARALRHIDRYQPTGSLQGWLITIMKNQFRETKRRRLLDRAAVPREQILAELSGARFNPPQYDQLLLRELAVAIPRLPPFQRDVLIAVCLQGLSYEQAGAKLGIPVGTIDRKSVV